MRVYRVSQRICIHCFDSIHPEAHPVLRKHLPAAERITFSHRRCFSFHLPLPPRRRSWLAANCLPGGWRNEAHFTFPPLGSSSSSFVSSLHTEPPAYRFFMGKLSLLPDFVTTLTPYLKSFISGAYDSVRERCTFSSGPKVFLLTRYGKEGVDLGADWERTSAQEARSLEGNETDETERHH